MIGGMPLGRESDGEFSAMIKWKSIFLPKGDLDFSDLIENIYGISKVLIQIKCIFIY